MGKTKKSRLSRVDAETKLKSGSLVDQLTHNTSVRAPGRSKARQRAGDDEFVDDKLTSKILEQARKQQEDLEEQCGLSSEQPRPGRTVSLGAGPTQTDSESEEEEEQQQQDEFYDTMEVDEADEKALERFMSSKPPTHRTLADIIQEKITEKQTEIHSQLSDNASVQMQQLDDRVVKMYKTIGQILHKYRSGKLPKAFKIVPAMANWEQLLYLTEPEMWSAATVYQATRIFSSNLNAKMAQRYYNLVLLPRIRDDIAEYKRLNVHLFMAIKKSLFKPAAFFKGLLIPLCESGTCTLREATIVCGVIIRNSIPMLHSAAAILKIAEMEYNGANSIFLRTLLNKKYALPFRVIDAVIFHFLGFRSDQRELPVLWHQALLTFAQRYKEDMSSEQKEALIELLRIHQHPKITPEIRREIVGSKCRDEESAEGAIAAPDIDMD